MMTEASVTPGQGIEQMLHEKARDLAKFAERAGYSRGHVDGYLQAIHACAEVVRCGGMVDAEYLTMLVNRPLVCRLCGDPLSEVQRLMGDFCDPCGKNGEDAR